MANRPAGDASYGSKRRREEGLKRVISQVA